jgi:hypothetical protein
MKFQTYASTPGLERYSPPARFSVWRDLHKRLTKDDPNYRKRVQAYRAGIMGLSVITCAASLGASHGVWLVLDSGIALGLTVGVIYLAFQAQDFMNQSIGRVLQSSNAGANTKQAEEN